jgi:hypothetical protein
VCNAGLQLVRVEQIHNAQLLECQEKQWARSSHLNKLVLPFSGVEMMGSLTETTATWFLGHTHKPTSHHFLLSSKEILRLFQVPLEVPGIW